jgi:hypothetical protein
MPLPFRNPVYQTGDGDPPEWSPPDYAKPVESDSSEAWKPPEYAKAVEDKPARQSVFSKIKEAVVNPKPFHPGEGPKAKIDRFLGDVISTDKHPYIKRLLTSQDPGQESALPTTKEAGIKEPTTFSGGFIKGLYDEFVRPLSSAAGAGMALAFGAEAPDLSAERATATSAKELPIRQSKEIPYKFAGDLPSSETVMSNKATNVKEYMKKNPDAKMTDIENFIKSVKSTEAPVKESVADEIPLPVRSPNLDLNRFPIVEEEAPKPSIKSDEDIKYDIARDKFNMGRPLPEQAAPEEKPKVDWNPFEKKVEEVKPTAEYVGTQPGFQDIPEVKLYNVKSGKLDRSTVSAETLKKEGIEVPESKTEWKPPEYAKPVDEPQVVEKETSPLNRFRGSAEFEKPTIEAKDLAKTPESLHPQLTGLKNYGDGVLYLDFDKTKPLATEDIKSLFPDKNVDVTELYSGEGLPNRYRIDVKGNDPVHSDQLGNEIEQSVGGAFDSTTELHGGLGGMKPPKKTPEPIKGPYGAALDKLFNSLGKTTEQMVQQEGINKVERAKRFTAFAGVKTEGMAGAKQSLSQLRGEFDKVDPEKLILNPKEADTLFTAVKRSKITEGEKARGYTALFKILNGESVPQRNELRILDDVFGQGFADRITEMHGGIGAVGLKISKLANTMKSMENAISLAAPLRHGIGLVARKEFYPAFSDMFKFFGDKEFYNASMQAIEDHPNYLKARESGLFISKPNSILQSEEEFLNSYVGSLPRASGIPQTVAASQRAYMGFLNKLRFDTMNSMFKKAEGLGNKLFTQVGDQVVASKEAKAITKYINTATGRGDLGSLNKMTNELNTLLWSPRMIASRIQMFNPKIYTNLPKGMRLEGLKSLLGIASLGTVIDTLAAYGGAKVSNNILSTDFGKSRFGTHLIDPWGGFQQYITGAARFLAGKTDSSQPTSRLEIAGRFMANKESPAASLAHTLLTAKKFTGKSDDPATAGNFTTQYGEKTSIQSQIGKQFIPIFIQDLQDLAKTEPDFSKDVGLDIALGAASLTGMAQDYPEKKKLQFGKMRLQ